MKKFLKLTPKWYPKVKKIIAKCPKIKMSSMFDLPKMTEKKTLESDKKMKRTKKIFRIVI